MPRIIFKCPYIKPGTEKAAAHLNNYVRYIAARDGAEKLPSEKASLPATKKQQAMVERLLQDFPLSRGMLEYEDYAAASTRGAASEFITRAIEDNYDQIAKRENYISYIAQRPRVERLGSHGLFSSTGTTLSLSKISEEVANHPGNVWLPIISLRREDAARLGYDNARQWQAFLTSYAMEMAEAMKIPWAQFRWYAAFHDEGTHPHVHMVCCSADGKSGFLSKAGIAKIKSGLAKEIFRQELISIYQQQTVRRDELVQKTGEVMDELIQQMHSGALENPRIEQLVEQLSQRLKNTSGKKQYGYLKAPVKAVVDEIVDELAKDPRIATAYDLWYQLREEVLRTYKDDLPQRLPLSQQKEFKRVKNLVIEEAVRLGEYTEVFSPEVTTEPADQESAEANTGQDAQQVLEDIPHVMDAPEVTDEAPPAIAWSSRYKQAQFYLFGDDDTSPDFEKAYSLFLEEALAGNALAMHDLGRMFADGLGRDPNAEQSQAWYGKALNAFLTVENEKPNRYVEYRIGKMYAAGLGIDKDHGSAADWFMDSAEQNYQYAQYSLAGLYYRGQGVEQDHQKAHRLYKKAAVQGFPYAAWELGKMYRDGVGCVSDAEQAAVYFTMAFHGFQLLERWSHDDKLRYRIGWMLLHGVGAEQDKSAAMGWFEKSARLGNPHAQYQIAKCILSDPTSRQEQITDAAAWLTQAAEAGLDYAQYALGKLYRDGGPVEQDMTQAVIWFTQAAEQGSEYALYALGKLHLGVENLPTALNWFQRSAEMGNQFAQYRLGKLLLDGDGVTKDAARALHWLTESAEQGSQYAQYALGKLYLLGKDIQQDRGAAVRWFTLAAEQGNQYAQYFLDHMNDSSSVLTSATRLLHHMGNIFREQAPHPAGGIYLVDSKLKRKIREKKIAMGHKPDDHEEHTQQFQ